jgi:hypothetical protein
MGERMSTKIRYAFEANTGVPEVDGFFRLVVQSTLNVMNTGHPEQVEMETSAGTILVVICKSKLAPPLRRKRK